MATLQQNFEFAQLAQAAYARLDLFEDRQDALRDPDGGAFASKQASIFLEKYTVLDQSANPNDPYGFSATLFQNIDPNDPAFGQITLAIRGTEPGVQGILGIDITDADKDIATYGAAFKQIASLYNYWQRLITPLGQTTSQLIYEESTYAPTDRPYVQIVEGRYISLRSETVAGAGLGVLSPTSQVNVTGHSLGGHLAQAFSLLFGQNTASVYTYNAPGFKTGTSDTRVAEFFSLFPGSTSYPSSDVITHVFGRDNQGQTTVSFNNDSRKTVQQEDSSCLAVRASRYQGFRGTSSNAATTAVPASTRTRTTNVIWKRFTNKQPNMIAPFTPTCL